MTPGGKLILGMVGVAGITGGYLYYLKRKASRLLVMPSIRIHALDAKGLIIRLDIVVKNPSLMSVSFYPPFVKVEYGQMIIGSSDPDKNMVEISGSGTTTLTPIEITIPKDRLMLAGGNALLAVITKSEKKINLAVKTETNVPVPILKNIVVYTSHELEFDPANILPLKSNNKKSTPKKSITQAV